MFSFARNGEPAKACVTSDERKQYDRRSAGTISVFDVRAIFT